MSQGGINVQNSNKKHDKLSADRKGCFIGHIRVYEGITLEQLALGLDIDSNLKNILLD